ncbi:hypothetical protein ACH5RR_028892 [Cinchona calisaya]|uniref:Uncharacterized protein n=1 Tax=Cinchona calisaya TaxID=153742 RepID=A0ABD2YRI3_9GENT
MVSNNPVDSILLHLELALNKLREWHSHISCFDEFECEFQSNLLFLKIILLYATKWSNNHHMFLESNDDHNKLDLPSFLSSIEDIVNKIGRDIESLCRRSQTSIEFMHTSPAFLPLRDMAYNLRENIKSFKQEIIKVYITLSDYHSSIQSSCCLMRGDELVDIIDSISKNLVCLLEDSLSFEYMHASLISVCYTKTMKKCTILRCAP